jgi:hypothetical protein
MTPEEHQRQLEYYRTRRKEKAEADKAQSLANRRKIAAAILAYEMLQNQEANG